jgi:hypothetical protein
MNDLFQKQLDKYLDKMHELNTQDIMTLGEFIKQLEKCNQEAIVTLEPFELYPTDFDSYRGYYCDLALGYTTTRDEIENCLKVSDLLKKAKNCLGKEFIGYKGGEFIMSKDTPLWISNYGEVSDTVIGEIREPLDGYVEIHCYKRELT